MTGPADDVLIVGGGLIGRSVALAVAQRGLRVALLDTVEPGISSPAGAGMLAPATSAGATPRPGRTPPPSPRSSPASSPRTEGCCTRTMARWTTSPCSPPSTTRSAAPRGSSGPDPPPPSPTRGAPSA
ncbi:MAG: FAD-dependent oxidoreductase [Gemmatimonadetes bacterium]|nr:FAD-dependent oxidoreductase [Gemmatimonadota bacterium]